MSDKNNDTSIEELSTEITLADLKTIASIIDLATSKGVFKGADLTAVGVVYDKIVSVVNSKK